jgi:membrane protein DedA with SNARE-associated domain
MFSLIFNWFLVLAQHLNYLTVGVLMTVESSFLPLPSEIVIPPAAYLASQGQLNIFWLVVVGVLGSVIGASINYLLSRLLGRLVIYELSAKKWARFLFITPEKLAKVEKSFLQNANSATFFSRLIPVARHLISIPAGFCGMPYGPFVLYTALGSAIWVSILAGLGYFLGANQALPHQYAQLISWSILGLVVLWVIWLLIKKKLRK